MNLTTSPRFPRLRAALQTARSNGSQLGGDSLEVAGGFVVAGTIIAAMVTGGSAVGSSIMTAIASAVSRMGQ